MNPALEDAIKEAFASAPSSTVVYETLEIRQTGVQSPIFIVKSRRTLVATDENGVQHEFEPVGFQLTLPPSNEEGFTSLNIAIDNVGLRVTSFVEAAKSQVVPVEVIYRPYVSTDLTKPQMTPPIVMYLKDVRITAAQVTGRATFMDIVNKKFPAELYTRARFPSLG